MQPVMSLGAGRAIQGGLSRESAALNERHLACAEEYGRMPSFTNAEDTPAQLPDVDFSRAKPSSIQRATYLYQWDISKE